MLLLTTIVVFVKSTRSPRVLAAKRGKVIDHRDSNSDEEGNNLGRRRKSEGSVGSNPSARKIIISTFECPFH